VSDADGATWRDPGGARTGTCLGTWSGTDEGMP
jgi:hypothetical protein